MKPGDCAFVLRKLRRDMSTVAHLGSTSVQLEPLLRERWQSHLDNLELVADELENNPAKLCTEAQLIEAVLASETARAAVLERSSVDALCGSLARHGLLLLDTTPVPDDHPEPPEAA